MIFRLLDAYEQEIKREDSFFKKVKKMTSWKKVMLAFMLVLIIALIPILLWVKSELFKIIYIAFYLLTFFVIDEIQKKDRQKNYLSNLNDYNERLDKLNKVLHEKFHINASKKLEAIIKSINLYLQEVKTDRADRKQSRGQWYVNTIIPLITFVFGTIAAEISAHEAAGYGLALLILIICARVSFFQIIETGKAIFETTPIKMQYLLKELQDLYDRDYIEDSV